jgi:ABC-type transport system involved in multi-copper enzyme maturation permease subunit
MLHRVRTIAFNTYRESVRARILLGLAGVAFFVSLVSLTIASFTLGSAPRVVSDLGSASMSIFAIAVAIVIGATSLHRELEQKTIFPILARPIGRGEYVIGKYLGILVTIGTFLAADAGLVLLLCSAHGGQKLVPLLVTAAVFPAALGAVWAYRPKALTLAPIPWSFALLVAGIFLSSVLPDERRAVLTQAFLTFFEVAIVAAVATLMSAFSTPFLSALMTAGVWVIGRLSDWFARFPKKFFGPEVAGFFKGLGKVWPNLHAYVPPRPLLTGEAADVDRAQYLLLAGGTAVAWAVGLLALATIVFKRRDFL